MSGTPHPAVDPEPAYSLQVRMSATVSVLFSGAGLADGTEACPGTGHIARKRSMPHRGYRADRTGPRPTKENKTSGPRREGPTSPAQAVLFRPSNDFGALRSEDPLLSSKCCPVPSLYKGNRAFSLALSIPRLTNPHTRSSHELDVRIFLNQYKPRCKLQCT